MKLETNGDYNPVQLNETKNLSPDGKVLSKSLMLNLRGESPKEVWKAYQELKKLVDGKEDKPEKKSKNNPGIEKKPSEKEQKNDENVCPKCGGILIERKGISRNGVAYHFKGCCNFPICSYTRNIPDKEPIPIADQDLMVSVEE